MSKISILKDLFAFLMEQKKWWLIPIILLLVIIGIIMIFAQNSAIAPFIYTFF